MTFDFQHSLLSLPDLSLHFKLDRSVSSDLLRECDEQVTVEVMKVVISRGAPTSESASASAAAC